MMPSEDPVGDFLRWDWEQARWLERRPVCVCCGHRIQDDWLMAIDGLLYHRECAVEEFERDTEDFVL